MCICICTAHLATCPILQARVCGLGFTYRVSDARLHQNGGHEPGGNDVVQQNNLHVHGVLGQVLLECYVSGGENSQAVSPAPK